MIAANACGGCTACCTLMAVDFPTYKKPPRETCVHCVKGGCGIYAERPDPCAGFQCGWLVSQQMDPRDAMPANARPDRSGVVIEVNTKGNAVLHCRTPEAWRGPAIFDIVRRLVRRTNVIIEHPDEMRVIEKDMSVTRLRKVGSAPNGENLYTRENAA